MHQNVAVDANKGSFFSSAVAEVDSAHTPPLASNNNQHSDEEEQKNPDFLTGFVPYCDDIGDNEFDVVVMRYFDVANLH